MIKTIFDVLIVYSDRLAQSASSQSDNVAAPFAPGRSCESYNVVYGYFLKICQENNVHAAFTTASDIIGAGECSSYWLFDDGEWTKVNDVGYSRVIFDKFSPLNARIRALRELLFSSPDVQPFNDSFLFDLFFDKHQTYEQLLGYAIPTVALKDSTLEGIKRARKELQKLVAGHAHKTDFSDEIVMKDRFGAGGMYVYKFAGHKSKEIQETMQSHAHISYIIQPLVQFDTGYLYRGSHVAADIRLIYLGGKIIQTYIRTAKQGDFRCNEHQGGTLTYLEIHDIPQNVIAHANSIADTLHNNSSLYTLDFLVSNSGNVYFLEGNTNPGLDWNLSLRENEFHAQKLIRLIVAELAKRAAVHSGKQRPLRTKPHANVYLGEPSAPLLA